jgi:hypothetical protein
MSTKASKNPDSNSTPTPTPNAQPSSPPNPSIDLGYAAAQREYQTQRGESSGMQTHRTAKLVPLRVKSVAMADSDFIPLATAHSLAGYHVVGVTWRPVKGDEMISFPPAETKTGLEFHHKTIQAFGVVLTRTGQLVLLPANGLDQKLPDGSELAGTIPAPKGTHLLRAHDRVTDEEMYTLGIVFPNTVQPDWVGLALDRREKVLAELEEERREREAERRAEMEAERLAKVEASKPPKPMPTFETSDIEVVRRMRSNYGYLSLNIETSGSGESLRYHVDDPNGFGPGLAAAVADERAELERANVDADAEFAKRRDRADEHARAMQVARNAGSEK